MRRRNILRTMLLAVLIINGAAALLSCNTGNTARPNPQGSATTMNLQERLASAIERKRNNTAQVTVDLKTLSNLDWDKFYTFAPFTPADEIRRALGFDWSGLARTGIDRRDDINLLVFVKDNAVVEHVEYPRRRGDFYKIKRPEGFRPDEAIFEVREENQGEPWLVLYPSSGR
ncbi:MAG TPA: hypothetical protein VF666_10485 [Pyrinomonadaceae bacterium]|jgi:hypothetical protein